MSSAAGNPSDVPVLSVFPAVVWILRRSGLWRRWALLFVLVALTFPIEGRAQLSVANGQWAVVQAGNPSPDVVGSASATAGKSSATLPGMPLARSSAEPQWFISEVKRSGLTLRGRIAIVGASFLSVGQFEGSLDLSGNLAGVMLDKGGNRVATVTGEVTDEGFSGLVLADNGEVGEWSWKSPDPKHLRKTLREALHGR
jgi:hypothetical protein